MPTSSAPLAGTEVVITRPAGTARSLARRVRALGGVPRLLPGLSLRAMPAAAARAAWREAQHCALMIFTSPAAVRFAMALGPLRSDARLLAIGRGTRDALRRAGHPDAQSPPPGAQRSEGLLAHPWLTAIDGMRVALVTAPGGRGVLEDALATRGARLLRVDVYHRVPPRLTRRHEAMLAALPPGSPLLVTSAQALDHLLATLSAPGVALLRRCRVVVSSERLARHARAAGFVHVARAASPVAEDLLAAAAALRG